MNLLTTIRQRRGPWAKRFLGLFVVVWLNVALQPCAIAFGIDSDLGCLHCPAEHSEDIHSTGSHEADQADFSTSPQEPNASHCVVLDDFNYDGRTAKVKVEDPRGDVPIGIFPSAPVISLENSLSILPCIVEMSHLPGKSQSLNALYGVYLI